MSPTQRNHWYALVGEPDAVSHAPSWPVETVAHGRERRSGDGRRAERARSVRRGVAVPAEARGAGRAAVAVERDPERRPRRGRRHAHLARASLVVRRLERERVERRAGVDREDRVAAGDATRRDHERPAVRRVPLVPDAVTALLAVVSGLARLPRGSVVRACDRPAAVGRAEILGGREVVVRRGRTRCGPSRQHEQRRAEHDAEQQKHAGSTTTETHHDLLLLGFHRRSVSDAFADRSQDRMGEWG